MMPRLAAEISTALSQQIERIVRDGWYPDEEALVRDALAQFVEGKSFIGDSPIMLQRFAADALNESKPETALKFTDRALSLLEAHKFADLALYQALVELRVQILVVVERYREALVTLEEAQQRLPNSPSVRKWMEKLRAKQGDAT